MRKEVVLETISYIDDFTLTADTGIGVDLTLAMGFDCR